MFINDKYSAGPYIRCISFENFWKKGVSFSPFFQKKIEIFSKNYLREKPIGAPISTTSKNFDQKVLLIGPPVICNYKKNSMVSKLSYPVLISPKKSKFRRDLETQFRKRSGAIRTSEIYFAL